MSTPAHFQTPLHMDSFDGLVDLVSADFPQARLDQLERLCELVRAALPRLGELGCPLLLTRRLVEGARALAANPMAVQPALLSRELGDGGGADAGAPAAAPASGSALAAEFATLLLVETFARLAEMPRRRLSIALRAYDPAPAASAAAAELEAGVREVVVSDVPLDEGERMAAVLDDDDDNGAFLEPFHEAPRGAGGAARPAAAALADPPVAANGERAEPPPEAVPWAELHAKLASLAGCATYTALSALPADKWSGPSGLGARACALAASVAARASARLRGGAAAEPCALDGLDAQVWTQLLVERMLHAPACAAELLPPLIAALSQLPTDSAGANAAAGAGARAPGGRSERLSVCAALQDDARWAQSLGSSRPAVHRILLAQHADLASALHELSGASIADFPAFAPSASGPHADGGRPVLAQQQQQLHVAAAATAVRYWCAHTPQPTGAERRACVAALLDSGLWAAAIRLLAPAPPAPRRPTGGTAGLWRAVLEGACRHEGLARFCADAPHFRRAADSLEPAQGGAAWAWAFAAIAGADAQAAAALKLGALVDAALVQLAAAAAPAGAGRGGPQPAPAALVQALEALELLCGAPHGAWLDPAGSGALGGALGGAHADTQSAFAAQRAAAGLAAGALAAGADKGDQPARAGGEAEGAEKAAHTLAQIQLRIKAVRCAAAGKRD